MIRVEAKELLKALHKMEEVDQATAQKIYNDHRKNGTDIIEACKAGGIREDAVLYAVAQLLGMDSVQLGGMVLPPALIEKVPAHVANSYRIIPVRMEDKTLVIATADPDNLAAMDDLKFMLGVSNVRSALTSESAITDALEQYYQSSVDEDEEGRARQADELARHRGEHPGPAQRPGDLLDRRQRPRRPRHQRRQRRRRVGAGAQAAQPHPADRRQGAGRGHPLRALRRGLPRAQPHRRRALRDAAGAQEPVRAAGRAHQGHGAPRHLRAAHAAGRQDPGQDRRPRGRPARQLPADHVRRVGRDPHPGPPGGEPGPRQGRLPRRAARPLQEGHRAPQRHRRGHRPDRFGQDDHALLGAVAR